ncbi:MAG: hypothetical protein B0D91_14360 [Oceanospirillales bacterium LUC14_002_19_P2]|nr:MAG: hypothetical protein B0D91_14360 [Oceanospirillales bacterium LUC14_002_19_P2]
MATLLSSPTQALAAEPLTPEERQIIHQAVLEKETFKIETEATRRTDDALARVFSTPFYDVTIIQHSDNHTQEESALLTNLDGQMVELKAPNTNQPLPDLQRLLNKDFQIKSPQDAFLLEEAMDILYPIRTTFGNEDLNQKAVLENGNQWLFIRGAFFEDLKGFVFKTDASGNITDASYALRIPANLPIQPIKRPNQSLTEVEKQAIHAAILKRDKVEIETDITKLESKALIRAFSAQFYDTTITRRNNNYSSESEVILAMQKGQVIEIDRPSTNQPVPELKKFLKKDFQLKSRQDASILEEALDILYPISEGYGSEDMEHKAIRQNGNQWLFIRGVFFRDLMGFIFETDNSGNILSVDYSLEIPDNK